MNAYKVLFQQIESLKVWSAVIVMCDTSSFISFFVSFSFHKVTVGSERVAVAVRCSLDNIIASAGRE